MDPFTNVICENLHVKALIELNINDRILTPNGYVKIQSIKFRKYNGYMIKQEIGDTLLLADYTKIPLYIENHNTIENSVATYYDLKTKKMITKKFKNIQEAEIWLKSQPEHPKYISISEINEHSLNGFKGFKGKVETDQQNINYKIYREALNKTYKLEISSLSAILDSAEFINGIYIVDDTNPDILLLARSVGMIAAIKDKIYITGRSGITRFLPRKEIDIKKYYSLYAKELNSIEIVDITLEKPSEIFLEDFSIIFLE